MPEPIRRRLQTSISVKAGIAKGAGMQFRAQRLKVLQMCFPRVPGANEASTTPQPGETDRRTAPPSRPRPSRYVVGHLTVKSGATSRGRLSLSAICRPPTTSCVNKVKTRNRRPVLYFKRSFVFLPQPYIYVKCLQRPGKREIFLDTAP